MIFGLLVMHQPEMFVYDAGEGEGMLKFFFNRHVRESGVNQLVYKIAMGVVIIGDSGLRGGFHLIYSLFVLIV